MYHNILTQKTHPNYCQIKKLVKILLKFIETDTIYFSCHLEEKINIGIITVLVSENNPNSWDDIYEYSSNLFKAYPEFSFRIFNASWLKRSLHKGNIFFILHCSERELVYSTDDCSSILSLKTIDSKRLIKKAKESFRNDFNENRIIGRDKNYHLRCENFTMAAYTIHQQLRSLFINISLFMTGEWIVEHSLEWQQNRLLSFCNSLGKAFDPEKEEEWFLLEQLDNARQAIQHNVAIEPISKKTVEAASAKLDWVEEEVRRLFEQWIKETKKIMKDYGK